LRRRNKALPEEDPSLRSAFLLWPLARTGTLLANRPLQRNLALRFAFLKLLSLRPMKTTLRILVAVLLLVSTKVFAQTETPPECLNLEEVQQKIGFPLEAKRAGAKGKVVAKLTVEPNGKVSKSEIIESPSQLLSDAVLAQIGGLKFKPAKMDGKAIKSIVQVPINFDNGGGEPKVFTSLEEALTTTELVEELDLSGQKLNALDARIVRLKSLLVIHLDDNNFTEVPAVLAKLPALLEIDLSGNQIKSIPGFLKKMSSLQSLDLSNNQIPKAAIDKARESLDHIELLTD
jgi:TonB family protein